MSVLPGVGGKHTLCRTSVEQTPRKLDLFVVMIAPQWYGEMFLHFQTQHETWSMGIYCLGLVSGWF